MMRELTPGDPAIPQLTERQTEILSLLADGWTEVEIASKLFVAPGTIRRHVAHCLLVLGARNRVHAVALAMRDGYIS